MPVCANTSWPVDVASGNFCIAITSIGTPQNAASALGWIQEPVHPCHVGNPSYLRGQDLGQVLGAMPGLLLNLLGEIDGSASSKSEDTIHGGMIGHHRSN